MSCPWCACDKFHYLDSSGCVHERSGFFTYREPSCQQNELIEKIEELQDEVKSLKEKLNG